MNQVLWGSFWRIGFATLSLAGSLAAEPLKGGGFELVGGVTSGGGRVTGGSFALDGAAGQSATDTLTWGTFQLTGGLIGIQVMPGDLTVFIERLEDGQARLTWASNAAGFRLEFTSGLSSEPVWQPVTPGPSGNLFTTPLNKPLRYVRLRRP